MWAASTIKFTSDPGSDSYVGYFGYAPDREFPGRPWCWGVEVTDSTGFTDYEDTGAEATAQEAITAILAAHQNAIARDSDDSVPMDAHTAAWWKYTALDRATKFRWPYPRRTEYA